MSNQRILGKMASEMVLCLVLLLALYLIHELGHLVLFNLLSGKTEAMIAFDGSRLVVRCPIRLHPIADRLMRGGGLLATYPAVVLVNKRTPFLGFVALAWIVYGIYEAFILGIFI
ncbi:MAG: hypothetical protein ACFFAY_04650 [Promethearchaeota archaeon]